jgi:hypothetical protein
MVTAVVTVSLEAFENEMGYLTGNDFQVRGDI